MNNILKIFSVLLVLVVIQSSKAFEYQSISDLINEPINTILASLKQFEPYKALTMINEKRCYNEEILDTAVKMYKLVRFQAEHSLEKEIKDRFFDEAEEYLIIIKLVIEKLEIKFDLQILSKPVSSCIIL